MSRDHPTFRATALDVAHSARRTIVVTGPHALPPVAVLVDRYNALSRLGPAVRLCLEPATHTNRWRIRPMDGAEVLTAVEALPPGAAATQLIPQLRALRSQPAGIRILHAGDYLGIDFCHGLGEAAMANVLLDVLFGVADPTAPDFLTPYRRRIPTLLNAGVRVAATGPRRIAALWDLHRRRPHPGASSRSAEVFVPSPATSVIGLPAAVVDELRALRAASAPGVSLTALCTYALWQSFARAGLPVDNVVKIPFDARRYLPRRASTLESFSAGLDFALDPAGGPRQLQHDMNRSAQAGRPVANLVISTVKARRTPAAAAERQPTAPRARLLHSNVLRGARTELWPFTDRAAARVLVASDPAGAEGVTVTSAWSSGNLWFTAAFHDNVFDRNRVEAALPGLEDGVRALLTRRGPAAPAGRNTR